MPNHINKPDRRKSLPTSYQHIRKGNDAVYQRIIGGIVAVVIVCTCMPNSRVYAGWPYLTKTQFIEDDWQLKRSRYSFTFKDGIIGIKSTVWGYYKFIDGWTIRFKRRDMESLGIIVTIEKVENSKMIWWITDMNGNKLRNTPYLTWIRR